MRTTDRQAFAELLAGVLGFYRRDCSDVTIGIFWGVLERFELTEVRRALTLHVGDPDKGQFAPMPADLVRMLEGSTTSQGAKAWALVERAVRSVGKYRSVVFDDPLIHAVISEMGGWVQLCSLDESEVPFRAKDFERLYTSYRSRRQLPQFPRILIGEHQANNRMLAAKMGGSEWEVQPLLIGDPARAAEVMRRGGEAAPLRLTDAGQMATRVVERIAGGASHA